MVFSIIFLFFYKFRCHIAKYSIVFGLFRIGHASGGLGHAGIDKRATHEEFIQRIGGALILLAYRHLFERFAIFERHEIQLDPRGKRHRSQLVASF